MDHIDSPKGSFASAVDLCDETPDCKAVYDIGCKMGEQEDAFGLYRFGEWVTIPGDCIYMKPVFA